MVVRTAAVPDSNAEWSASVAQHLPGMKYAELLGEVMAERFGIAVAGTHGKSTTTAMIAYALLRCGADPSFVVGGTVPQLGGGSRSGSGNAFVAEACEFDRSFHHLRPRVAMLLNVEEDHLDCYKDLAEIIASFRRFAELVPAGGRVLANGQDENVAAALAGLDVTVETVGLDGAQTWSTRPMGLTHGCYRGEVSHKGRPVAELVLAVAGRHNLFNATMAVAACAAYGVSPDRAAEALRTFTGVDRRMSEVGRVGQAKDGAIVVDDYGHHPTEIRATLGALRERYQPERLLCVFQPHQHSRTRFLLEDFAASFAAADLTIVPDIYFVRDSESERHLVSSRELVDRIEQAGQRALHLPEFPDIVRHLRAEAKPGDLIVTMGAGNVWEVGRDLVG